MKVMGGLIKNRKLKDTELDITGVVSTFVIIVATSVMITYFILNYICFTASVAGSSMEDTYQNDDTVHVSMIREVTRGDVIVFYSPYDNEALLIKRCVAIPGDAVEIKNDHLYINDTAVEEPYIKNSYVGNPGLLSERVVLKKDEYIVLGDNRLVSLDSREFGVINKSNIKGGVK